MKANRLCAKTSLVVCALAVALLFQFGASGALAQSKVTVIRWNLDSGPDDTLSLRALKTRDLIQSDPELKDLFKVELYYSNSLLKAPDAVEALIRGDIQMAFSGAWYWEKLAPNIIVADIPFLFRSHDSINKFYDSPLAEQAIYKDLSAKGVKCLAMSPVGSYSILSTESIATLEDFKGKKIRTVGNGAHVVTALGAVPISMSAADIYIALQRNTINGANISPVSIVDRRLYEVAKYFLNTPMMLVSDLCGANKKWFDALPEKVQQKLVKYVKEGNEFKRQKTIEKEEDAVKKFMPSQGVKIFTPDANQLKAFKDATLPAWEVMRKKLADAGLLNKIEEMQKQ